MQNNDGPQIGRPGWRSNPTPEEEKRRREKLRTMSVENFFTGTGTAQIPTFGELAYSPQETAKILKEKIAEATAAEEAKNAVKLPDYKGLGRVDYDYNGRPIWIPYDENHDQDMNFMGPLIDGSTVSVASILEGMPDIDPEDVELPEEYVTSAEEEEFLSSGIWIVGDMIRTDREDHKTLEVVGEEWRNRPPEDFQRALEENLFHIEDDEEVVSDFLASIDWTDYSGSVFGMINMQKQLEENAPAGLVFPWENAWEPKLGEESIKDKAAVLMHAIVSAREKGALGEGILSMDVALRLLLEEQLKPESLSFASEEERDLYYNARKQVAREMQTDGWLERRNERTMAQRAAIKLQEIYDWNYATRDELRAAVGYKPVGEWREKVLGENQSRTVIENIGVGMHGIIEERAETMKAQGYPNAMVVDATIAGYEGFLSSVKQVQASAWSEVREADPDRYNRLVEAEINKLETLPAYSELSPEKINQIAEVNVMNHEFSLAWDDPDALGFQRTLMRYGNMFDANYDPDNEWARGDDADYWGDIIREANRVEEKLNLLRSWEDLQTNLPRQRDVYMVEMANKWLGSDKPITSVRDMIAYTDSVRSDPTLSNAQKAMKFEMANSIWKGADSFVSTSTGKDSIYKAQYDMWDTGLRGNNNKNRKTTAEQGNPNAINDPASSLVKAIIEGDPWASMLVEEHLEEWNSTLQRHLGGNPVIVDGKPLTWSDITGIDTDTGAPLGQLNVMQTIRYLGTDQNGDPIGRVIQMQYDEKTTSAIIKTLVEMEDRYPSTSPPKPVFQFAAFISQAFRDLTIDTTTMESLRANMTEDERKEFDKSRALSMAVISDLVFHFDKNNHIANQLQTALGFEQKELQWSFLMAWSNQFVASVNEKFPSLLVDGDGKTSSAVAIATQIITGDIDEGQILEVVKAADEKMAQLLADSMNSRSLYNIGVGRHTGLLNSLSDPSSGGWALDGDSYKDSMHSYSSDLQATMWNQMELLPQFPSYVVPRGSLMGADKDSLNPGLVPMWLYRYGTEIVATAEQLEGTGINLGSAAKNRNVAMNIFGGLDGPVFTGYTDIFGTGDPTAIAIKSLISGVQYADKKTNDWPFFVALWADFDDALAKAGSKEVIEPEAYMSPFAIANVAIVSRVLSDPKTSRAARAAWSSLYASDIREGKAPSIDLEKFLTTTKLYMKLNNREDPGTATKSSSQGAPQQVSSLVPVEHETPSTVYNQQLAGGMVTSIIAALFGTIQNPGENSKLKYVERDPSGFSYGSNISKVYQKGAAGERGLLDRITGTNEIYNGHDIPHKPGMDSYNHANWLFFWSPQNDNLVDQSYLNNHDPQYKEGSAIATTFRDNGTGVDGAGNLWNYWIKKPEFVRTLLRDNLEIDLNRIRSQSTGTMGEYYYQDFYVKLSNSIFGGDKYPQPADKARQWNKISTIVQNKLILDVQEKIRNNVSHKPPSGFDTSLGTLSKGAFGLVSDKGFYASGEYNSLGNINESVPSSGELHLYVLHEILKGVRGDSELLKNLIKGNPSMVSQMPQIYQDLLTALDNSAVVRNGLTKYYGLNGDGREDTYIKVKDYDISLGKGGTEFTHVDNPPQGLMTLVIDRDPNTANFRSTPWEIVLPWTFDDRLFPKEHEEYGQYKEDVRETRTKPSNILLETLTNPSGLPGRPF